MIFRRSRLEGLPEGNPSNCTSARYPTFTSVLCELTWGKETSASICTNAPSGFLPIHPNCTFPCGTLPRNSQLSRWWPTQALFWLEWGSSAGWPIFPFGFYFLFLNQNTGCPSSCNAGDRNVTIPSASERRSATILCVRSGRVTRIDN